MYYEILRETYPNCFVQLMYFRVAVVWLCISGPFQSS